MSRVCCSAFLRKGVRLRRNPQLAIDCQISGAVKRTGSPHPYGHMHVKHAPRLPIPPRTSNLFTSTSSHTYLKLIVSSPQLCVVNIGSGNDQTLEVAAVSAISEEYAIRRSLRQVAGRRSHSESPTSILLRINRIHARSVECSR